jgi:hypothetical protein
MDFGFDYLGIFTTGMREVHHIRLVVFDRNNKQEKARAVKMLKLSGLRRDGFRRVHDPFDTDGP